MNKSRRYIEELKNISKQSAEDDYMMPIYFPFLPAVIIFGGVFILEIALERMSGGGGLALIGVLIIMLLGISSYIEFIYMLIKRRNAHFRRSKRFFKTLSKVIEELNLEKAQLIKDRIQQLILETTYRDPSEHAFYTLTIPSYQWKVFQLLNQDYVSHSRQEAYILDEIYDELRELGINTELDPYDLETIPERPARLYIFLTMATIGIFSFYWMYTLVKDANEHFKKHKLIEQDLIQALEKLARKQTTKI